MSLSEDVIMRALQFLVVFFLDLPSDYQKKHMNSPMSHVALFGRTVSRLPHQERRFMFGGFSADYLIDGTLTARKVAWNGYVSHPCVKYRFFVTLPPIIMIQWKMGVSSI